MSENEKPSIIDSFIRAALGDRLGVLFRRGQAFKDDITDVTAALDAINSRQTSRSSGVYLSQLTENLKDPDTSDPLNLSHEQRVSLYVAAKIITRKANEEIEAEKKARAEEEKRKRGLN